MAELTLNNQRTIITHAVLAGLTPLIPVPLVDDLAKNYIQRRMVRHLAASYRRDLSAEDLDALTREPGGGCLRGCLVGAIVYPLKKIFRKVFFFLEWKRAADLTSRVYHEGYLYELALREGWLGGGAAASSAAETRAAVEAVLRETSVKPVEGAITATFRQSKNVLLSAAGLLGRSLDRVTGSGRKQEEVARAVEEVEAEEERRIEGVISRLQKAIAAVPDEHFQQMRARLAARLASKQP